uniref:TBCC domain-containing protein n=1 Tax=Heterorhabditis bacteriophora TaxID=37862 RepID=A0A1I7W9I6_HETBA
MNRVVISLLILSSQVYFFGCRFSTSGDNLWLVDKISLLSLGRDIAVTLTIKIIYFWRSRSLIVDCVYHCHSLVFGPIIGTAVVRNTHSTTISIACKQIHIWNCSDLTIFLYSPRIPVIRGSRNIKFGPYNVSYEKAKIGEKDWNKKCLLLGSLLSIINYRRKSYVLNIE